ncbi:MAG: 3-hydroxyisobutyrate dehydrogenase-like beta-hydroxyacid dehydrogenase [Alphaproteobacteria bacterium]|jgi:3-hydroxyisobutyrate dehydrogenase
MSDADINVVATLGLGEAGTALTTGLVENFRGDNPDRRVLSVDTALHDNVRGAAINQRAHDIGVEISGEYGPSLSDAGFVMSVVTGVDAKHAANSAKEWLKPGSLFLDVNTLTGPQTAAISVPLMEAGIDYVDVAAMGGFSSYGHKVPFLLSGPAAERAAAFMKPYGFNVTVLSDKIGDASGVKIIRSVMIKGVEALSVECLVAAHRQGLVKEVLDCFSDVDERTFAGFVKSMAISQLIHAKRRMEEMEKAVENLDEIGIKPVMTERTIASHRRTMEADVLPPDGTRHSLEEALEILSEKVVGYSNK